MAEDSSKPVSSNQAGGFGSAANLMIEALEKAGNELENTVSLCMQQLTSFTEGLDQSLTLQLDKVVKQSSHLVDSHGNVLEAKRDETIDQMAEIEAREMEKLLSASSDIKKQHGQRVQDAMRELAELMEAQLKELNELVEAPSSELLEASKARALEAANDGQTAKKDINLHGETYENSMSDTAKSIDEEAGQVIEAARLSVEDSLASYGEHFDDKIKTVQEELDEIVKTAVVDLKRLARRGEDSISEARDTNVQAVMEQIEHWQEHLHALRDRFKANSLEQQSKHVKAYNDEIERTLASSQEEIGRIAQSARKRMSVNQKLFINTLRRAERQITDDIERLITKFEAAVAQEAKVHLLVSGSKLSAGPEVLEKLSSRLKLHGQEIIKTFKTQVDQTEQEFMRASQVKNERIESIRQSSVEALEKQVRIMRADLERIARSFNTELTDLNIKLPMIEESGRAAAMAVMTYKSAMLSLEND